MSDLIERLNRPQEIELATRPAATPDSFRSALERGFVPVRFPNTKGGTELGVKLDLTTSSWSKTDFSKRSGTVRITGTLILDYVKVQFHGDIDVATLKGTGYLEPVREV